MSERNSSSSRGVVVNRGVIQWGCSSFVLSTRANQFAKYPPPEDSWAFKGMTEQVNISRANHIKKGLFNGTLLEACCAMKYIRYRDEYCRRNNTILCDIPNRERKETANPI